MLPAQKRLPRPLFSTIAATRSPSVYNTLGTLKYLLHDTGRFSVVISKKVEKSAVQRNKLRRRIYGIIATIDRRTPLPFQGILYVSKQAPAMTRTTMQTYVEDLIQKIKNNTKQ